MNSCCFSLFFFFVFFCFFFYYSFSASLRWHSLTLLFFVLQIFLLILLVVLLLIWPSCLIPFVNVLLFLSYSYSFAHFNVVVLPTFFSVPPARLGLFLELFFLFDFLPLCPFPLRYLLNHLSQLEAWI